MFEQSVKLSRLIIFYFISNFLIYAPILPNREPKTSAFRSVFVFRAVFQPLCSCSVAARISSDYFVSLLLPQLRGENDSKESDEFQATNTSHYIAIFARSWSRADPNFAPLRWRIWMALSEFLCLLTNQNITFVILFCTKIPFFCAMLPKNCISFSQSQSRKFFMYNKCTQTAFKVYTPISIKVASEKNDAWSIFHSPRCIIVASLVNYVNLESKRCWRFYATSAER